MFLLFALKQLQVHSSALHFFVWFVSGVKNFCFSFVSASLHRNNA